MAIKKFTMREVDEEIMQIVQQQPGGQVGTGGPPNIIKALMNRAKAKRNGGNARNQT